MRFYTIEKIKVGSIASDGIEMNKMSQIYKQLGKTEEFKTLESISIYEIVYLENGVFIVDENIPFIGKVKKESFALIQPNIPFNIEYENSIYFAQIFKNKVHITISLENLKSVCIKPDLSHYSEKEIKAYEWLESGKTGLSSLNMCKNLLPNLNHENLSGLNIDSAYPHDPADFMRCLGLLNSVPELRVDMEKIRTISPKWDNLVNCWEEIEGKIKINKYEEAAILIKSCIEKDR